VEKPIALPPLSTAALAWRGLVGTIAGTLIAAALLAALAGLRGMKSAPGGEFLFVAQLCEVIQPVGIGGWMQLSGVTVFGVAIGLVTAALAAARRGGHDFPMSEDLE
jgi:hypothetical protein